MRLKTLLLILLLLLLNPFTLPANAHDQLVDISPADGEVLVSGDFELVLTFNNPLLSITGGQSAEIETQLEGSSSWVGHEVVVEGEFARASISLSEPGNYLVRWKVVSSDGHPITGESNFSLEIDAPEENEEPVVIAPNPNVEESSGGSLTGFYLGLAMVALGAIFAPIGLMMRRRAKRS